VEHREVAFGAVVVDRHQLVGGHGVVEDVRPMVAALHAANRGDTRLDLIGEVVVKCRARIDRAAGDCKNGRRMVTREGQLTEERIQLILLSKLMASMTSVAGIR
jgi:hypothetical protein